MQDRKAGATHEHEERGREKDEGRVVVAQRCVVRREPARGHGRERVTDRVEDRHAAQVHDEGVHCGERHVEHPQDLRGLGDPRREPVLGRTRAKIKELNKTTVELEKFKREKDEFEESIKAELEKELSKKLIEGKERIQKEESNKSELKFKELEKKLEDQKKLIEEMKRKQEQGSMQTQGEMQELGIEEWLVAKFPLDVILEIKKR